MDYYEILGVERDSPPSSIRAAFRQKVKKTHPDKNPNGREEFDKVMKAYQALSDPHKRRIYDTSGEKGLKEHPSSFFSPAAVWEFAKDAFYGTRPQAGDIVHPIQVTLEEIYNGTKRSLYIRRKLNRGGEDCALRDAYVKPGVRHGHHLILKGEGDEEEFCAPGDVVLVVQQMPHHQFKRLDDHLRLKHEVSIEDASSSFEFKISHLDNREITISKNKDTFLRTGDVLVIEGEGMPIIGEVNARGDLQIEFAINNTTPSQNNNNNNNNNNDYTMNFNNNIPPTTRIIKLDQDNDQGFYAQLTYDPRPAQYCCVM